MISFINIILYLFFLFLLSQAILKGEKYLKLKKFLQGAATGRRREIVSVERL